MEKEARLYEKLENGKVRCLICPRKCVIPEGGTGFCGTKRNKGGKLFTLVYGEVSSIGVDPIEKKPLFHFWPGSFAFSIATVGCNFKCPWCQNWEISQAKPGDIYTNYVPPERIVALAKRYKCRSIAYTYNEPAIWHDYVLDVAKLARKEGIFNVWVTNGYMSEEALDELLPYMDAANVDLKAMKEDFYTNYCKGVLGDVLNTIKILHEKGVHVELTNLIIPTLNDQKEDIEKLCKWILEELGPDVPLHISRFFPHYKFTHVPPTPLETLEMAYDTARGMGLHYVYTGNIPGHRGEHTYCPSCGEVVIKRWGFDIVDWKIKDRKCPRCRHEIPIRGEYEKRERGWWPFII